MNNIKYREVKTGEIVIRRVSQIHKEIFYRTVIINLHNKKTGRHFTEQIEVPPKALSPAAMDRIMYHAGYVRAKQ